MSPTPLRRAAAAVALSALLLTSGAVAAQADVVPSPTASPTVEPTDEPTSTPTDEPTAEPTDEPTAEPTDEPTAEPTDEPTVEPTDEPTAEPTDEPTPEPTDEPSPAVVPAPALTVVQPTCTGLTAGSTGRIVIEPGARTEWLIATTDSLFALSEEDVVEVGEAGTRGDVAVSPGVYHVFAFPIDAQFSSVGEWEQFDDFDLLYRAVTVNAFSGTCPVADELTPATKGGFTAPATVGAGGTLVLSGLPAGAALHGYLFSVPTDLGVATVAADGTLRLTVPASVAAGTHRVALYRADGTLLGWQYVEVLAAGGTGALAVTGVDPRAGGLAVAVLVAAGGALMLTRRRLTAV
ncbi:hypothetical protein ACFUMH_13765 [Cellulomonas sp. NPDC057328]|uniref:hypothetical protein n=1 Tax=Cellulomonas sp. NPDC057328 TaxID=3346101 RepID=UPI00362D10C2